MIPNDIETVLDGSVDAAGSGYGRSLQITQNKGSNPKYLMQIREGQWGSDKSKYSSKHRELQSLVESVKDDVREGQLTNGEVFFLMINLSLRAPTIEANQRTIYHLTSLDT